MNGYMEEYDLAKDSYNRILRTVNKMKDDLLNDMKQVEKFIRIEYRNNGGKYEDHLVFGYKLDSCSNIIDNRSVDTIDIYVKTAYGPKYIAEVYLREIFSDNEYPCSVTADLEEEYPSVAEAFDMAEGVKRIDAVVEELFGY